MYRLWGPITTDGFADNKNAKLTKFSSKFLCHNISQVDAFSIGCRGSSNYLVPQFTCHPQS